jgi:hypothetical protein
VACTSVPNAAGTNVASGCACSTGFGGTIVASTTAPFFTGSCTACATLFTSATLATCTTCTAAACTAGSCKSGYNTFAGGSCSANVCSCPNGAPTTAAGALVGALCEATGTVDCQSCATGHTLSAPAATGLQVCAPSPCSAPFSTTNGVSGGAGTTSGSAYAFYCNPGYSPSGVATCSMGSWNSPTCNVNICTCPNGTPTVGTGVGPTLCETNGAVDCSACSSGFAPAATYHDWTLLHSGWIAAYDSSVEASIKAKGQFQSDQSTWTLSGGYQQVFLECGSSDGWGISRILTFSQLWTTPQNALGTWAETYFSGDKATSGRPSFLQLWPTVLLFNEQHGFAGSQNRFLIRTNSIHCARSYESYGDPSILAGQWGRVWVRKSTSIPAEKDLPKSISGSAYLYSASFGVGLQTCAGAVFVPVLLFRTP